MDHGQFYATCAQVIPTLLVVMVLEVRRARPRRRRPGEWSAKPWEWVLRLFLVATLVGEVVALNATRLPDSDLQFQIVWVAVATQLGILALIGWFAIRDAAREADEHQADSAPAQLNPQPSIWWLVVVCLFLRRRG